MQVSNLGKYSELSHVASVQTCNALIFLDHWITEAQEEEFCHTILKQTNKQTKEYSLYYKQYIGEECYCQNAVVITAYSWQF